jgi:hypothetical protein
MKTYRVSYEKQQWGTRPQTIAEAQTEAPSPEAAVRGALAGKCLEFNQGEGVIGTVREVTLAGAGSGTWGGVRHAGCPDLLKGFALVTLTQGHGSHHGVTLHPDKTWEVAVVVEVKRAAYAKSIEQSE